MEQIRSASQEVNVRAEQICGFLLGALGPVFCVAYWLLLPEWQWYLLLGDFCWWAIACTILFAERQRKVNYERMCDESLSPGVFNVMPLPPFVFWMGVGGAITALLGLILLWS